jgi:molybdate transport system ATP-binding protein
VSHSGRLELSIKLSRAAFELALELDSTARVLGIFGRSGAGKSSLLEAIAGIEPNARGRIAFGGEPWLDSARKIRVLPERRGVGYVPQDGLLFPHLSVRDNLAYGALRGPGPRLETIAASLRIDTLLARDVRALSGGERQRVALGRALCSAPRLLLLDEPFGALEVPLRRSLVPFLLRVLAEAELPALFVSHDPVEVLALCDQVLVLEGGRLQAFGPPERALVEAGVWTSTGYENTFVCNVGGSASAPRALLGHGVELSASAVDELRPDAERALLVVPASDVIVATERPRALSARNVLEASVVAIEPLGRHHALTAELGSGGPRLVAEISADAIAELELAANKRIHLVVKASACRLYSSFEST